MLLFFTKLFCAHTVLFTAVELRANESLKMVQSVQQISQAAIVSARKLSDSVTKAQVSSQEAINIANQAKTAAGLQTQVATLF